MLNIKIIDSIILMEQNEDYQINLLFNSSSLNDKHFITITMKNTWNP